MNRQDGSDVSGIGRKRNSSDPSDSDSVELPTPLTIPIFDLHWIVTLLPLPIPTPLPIPSLVWTSPKDAQKQLARTPLNQAIDQLLLHRSTGEKQHERRRGAPAGAAMSCSWIEKYSKLLTLWYKFLNFWSLSVYTRLCLLIWFVQFLQFSLSGNTQRGLGFLNRVL